MRIFFLSMFIVAASTRDGHPRTCRGRILLRRERMLLSLTRRHFFDFRLALHRARDRKLGRLVVVLINLGVILRVPVDEDAAYDDKAIGQMLRNDPGRGAIRHGTSDGGLSRAEHLHGL